MSLLIGLAGIGAVAVLILADWLDAARERREERLARRGVKRSP